MTPLAALPRQFLAVTANTYDSRTMLQRRRTRVLEDIPSLVNQQRCFHATPRLCAKVNVYAPLALEAPHLNNDANSREPGVGVGARCPLGQAPLRRLSNLTANTFAFEDDGKKMESNPSRASDRFPPMER